MLRHLVIWDFKEELSYEQRQKYALKIKMDLENLQGIIPEIKSLKVHINLLPTSNCELILDSLFESVETLSVYQTNPDHKLVGRFIGEVTTNKRCIDYFEV